jgi:pyruvate kinase
MSISYNKTKIIATVGPACNTLEGLTKLVRAGVDVFRLNFSHGRHEEHQEVINHIREINRKLGTCIGILQDLQGPKIRLGEVEPGVVLKRGRQVILTTNPLIGDEKILSTIYKPLPKDVKPGESILLDDGKIELKVKEIKGVEVICEVIYGGPIKSKKGINLPDSKVSAPCLTDKDKEDLLFGLKNDVEWVALSFVHRAKDVVQLKDIIAKQGKTTRAIAKIERPDALKNIDEIIEVSDGIMVARGDLGVEILFEEVPMAQKMIVHKANLAAKPVIVATQMMESMIDNPRPTRAETNDVANAVMDGADALMLSAETAVGKYPIETIRSMTRTIKSIEDNADIYDKQIVIDPEHPDAIHDNLVSTACYLAGRTNAKALVGMTVSGYTAFKAAAHRPRANIFIFTENKPLLNTLNLVWGVRGLYYDRYVSTDDTFEDLKEMLLESKYIKKGDVFINMASMPMKARLKTNTIKIAKA